MLLLYRSVGESINVHLPDGSRVVIGLETLRRNESACLSVSAPPGVKVLRSEIDQPTPNKEANR